MNSAVAQTALGPMIIVAADQYESAPLVEDPWAYRLLPASGRAGAALTRWSAVRRALFAATEKRMRGGWASFLCRKRYIDDQLVNAVPKGVDAVVILGAGYDTRAYRLPELAGIPVCEVDLPANIDRKAAAVRRLLRPDSTRGDAAAGRLRNRRSRRVSGPQGFRPWDARGRLSQVLRHRLPDIEDQVGPDEYNARYLHTAGRQMTASEIERAVYAER
jgi:leucine carboxyl methyltransferase